jgi:hypothetical protein
MDEWDGLGAGMKIDRRATDYGQAALGICGLFLLMAPIQLFFNDFYWSIGIHHADRQEIELARVIGPIVGLTFLSLIGLGIFCGFRGMAIARATHQAIALPMVGVAVGFVDIVLWIGLTINLLAILGVLR